MGRHERSAEGARRGGAVGTPCGCSLERSTWTGGVYGSRPPDIGAYHSACSAWSGLIPYSPLANPLVGGVDDPVRGRPRRSGSAPFGAPPALGYERADVDGHPLGFPPPSPGRRSPRLWGPPAGVRRLLPGSPASRRVTRPGAPRTTAPYRRARFSGSSLAGSRVPAERPQRGLLSCPRGGQGNSARSRAGTPSRQRRSSEPVLDVCGAVQPRSGHRLTASARVSALLVTG